VAQLHPRALGFLFVASYDSQGYGGGILTHLHTGQQGCDVLFSLLRTFLDVRTPAVEVALKTEVNVKV
jgi:hypothetical protein